MVCGKPSEIAKRRETLVNKGLSFVVPIRGGYCRSASNAAKVTPLKPPTTRLVSFSHNAFPNYSPFSTVTVSLGGRIMKRRMAFQLAAWAGAIGMLAGCGDQRVASKGNLEHALNRDYSVNADCLFDKPLPFPYELSVSDPLLSETRHRLDALVEAGLLDSRPTSRRPGNRQSLLDDGERQPGEGPRPLLLWEPSGHQH